MQFFFPGSLIDIKGCVQIIRQQDKDFSEKHMNILRYTTKHLNDETTPKATKALFAFTSWEFCLFVICRPLFSKRLKLPGKKKINLNCEENFFNWYRTIPKFQSWQSITAFKFYDWTTYTCIFYHRTSFRSFKKSNKIAFKK